MTSVAVDLEDLETLVMTTGALKTVEQALNARKSDPFVRAHLDFTDAHDRLAAAIRSAQRSLRTSDTVIKYDAALTKEEERYLIDLDDSCAGYFIYHDEKFMPPRSIVTTLQAKGMVRRGRYLNGVLWDGDTHPQLKEDDRGFAVKLTDRGRQKVSEIRSAP